MKKFSLVLPLVLMAPSVTWASDFEDHKYAASISYLIENNIAEGYPDGNFRPDKYINRAELVKIAMGTGMESEPCFSDMDEDHWYLPYVCNAKDKGVVKGYDDGTFKGSEIVNLVEALKIVMLANEFDFDEKEGRRWYETGVKSALTMDIVPLDIEAVDQPLTRAQMAEIMMRLFEFQNGNSSASELDYEYLLGGFDPLSYVGEDIPEKTEIDVPFVAQAPNQDWVLPYREACEEAVLIMLNALKYGDVPTTDEADEQIINLVNWETDRGYIIDIGMDEMSDVARDYYSIKSIVYKYDEVTIDNIKKLLAAGYPVVVPVAGQHIGNNFYRPPGPPYHVLIITGYEGDNFITNDPGTQFGDGLTLDQQVLFDGIHDWAGSKDNVLEGSKAMLVLDT